MMPQWCVDRQRHECRIRETRRRAAYTYIRFTSIWKALSHVPQAFKHTRFELSTQLSRN